jgi:hypothetical protein
MDWESATTRPIAEVELQQGQYQAILTLRALQEVND